MRMPFGLLAGSQCTSKLRESTCGIVGGSTASGTKKHKIMAAYSHFKDSTCVQWANRENQLRSKARESKIQTYCLAMF